MSLIAGLITSLILEEVFVCIQSYLFTILSSLYLNDLTRVSFNKNNLRIKNKVCHLYYIAHEPPGSLFGPMGPYLTTEIVSCFHLNLILFLLGIWSHISNVPAVTGYFSHGLLTPIIELALR